MYPHINKSKQFGYAPNARQYDIYNSNNREASNSSGVQLTETKNGYHLELEIMGYVKDDFNFYFNNNDLVLTTGKSEETSSAIKVKSDTTKHSYCYASAFFKRTFHLPNSVIENEIFVDYKNHILSIDLLKLKPISNL